MTPDDRDDRPIALTIGTAGHVDHGKTTLVRYLTGTDTDRLEEEHRRGISIVPGYAELDLPGGRRASLVDVPGHERFVKNMVAGSTGVDAFLLVVAADDGVMPQTREHLDVLRVLGIEQGVVALTKTDVVDPETIELAELEVAELLESAGIEAPILRVSGVTGEGVEGLLESLDSLAETVEAAGHADSGLARLPVDRAFVLKGIGVVVTGTLWSGEIRTGDTLYTASGLRPRVRGIQNHGHPAPVARAGARTALDLAGVEASQLQPGEVLLSRPVAETRGFDARIRSLEGARPLKHGTRMRLHHGTRTVNVRVRLLGGGELRAGETALARLSLSEPLVVRRGDRFVLRSPAPQVTVGGGTVLDPYPVGRKPDPSWLKALESGDLGRLIPLYFDRNPGEGADADEISRAVGVESGDVAAVLDGVSGIVRVGDLYVPAAEVTAARECLLAALGHRAEEHPESPRLTAAEARTATGLGTRLADALVNELSGTEVRVTDAGVRLPDAGRVPPELEGEAAKLLEELRRAGAEPPATEPGAAIRLLLERGAAVELGPKLFASREAAENVLEEIKSACRGEGEISLGGLRDRLGTSRKYAQAWLEYSDALGVTSRTGDVRVLTRRHR